MVAGSRLWHAARCVCLLLGGWSVLFCCCCLPSTHLLVAEGAAVPGGTGGIREKLRQRVFGQPRAVDAVAAAVTGWIDRQAGAEQKDDEEEEEAEEENDDEEEEEEEEEEQGHRAGWHTRDSPVLLLYGPKHTGKHLVVDTVLQHVQQCSGMKHAGSSGTCGESDTPASVFKIGCVDTRASWTARKRELESFMEQHARFQAAETRNAAHVRAGGIGASVVIWNEFECVLNSGNSVVLQDVARTLASIADEALVRVPTHCPDERSGELLSSQAQFCGKTVAPIVVMLVADMPIDRFLRVATTVLQRHNCQHLDSVVAARALRDLMEAEVGKSLAVPSSDANATNDAVHFTTSTSTCGTQCVREPRALASFLQVVPFRSLLYKDRRQIAELCLRTLDSETAPGAHGFRSKVDTVASKTPLLGQAHALIATCAEVSSGNRVTPAPDTPAERLLQDIDIHVSRFDASVGRTPTRVPCNDAACAQFEQPSCSVPTWWKKLSRWSVAALSFVVTVIFFQLGHSPIRCISAAFAVFCLVGGIEFFSDCNWRVLLHDARMLRVQFSRVNLVFDDCLCTSALEMFQPRAHSGDLDFGSLATEVGPCLSLQKDREFLRQAIRFELVHDRLHWYARVRNVVGELVYPIAVGWSVALILGVAHCCCLSKATSPASNSAGGEAISSNTSVKHHVSSSVNESQAKMGQVQQRPRVRGTAAGYAHHPRVVADGNSDSASDSDSNSSGDQTGYVSVRGTEHALLDDPVTADDEPVRVRHQVIDGDADRSFNNNEAHHVSVPSPERALLEDFGTTADEPVRGSHHVIDSGADSSFHKNQAGHVFVRSPERALLDAFGSTAEEPAPASRRPMDWDADSSFYIDDGEDPFVLNESAFDQSNPFEANVRGFQSGRNAVDRGHENEGTDETAWRARQAIDNPHRKRGVDEIVSSIVTPVVKRSRQEPHRINRASMPAGVAHFRDGDGAARISEHERDRTDRRIDTARAEFSSRQHSTREETEF